MKAQEPKNRTYFPPKAEIYSAKNEIFTSFEIQTLNPHDGDLYDWEIFFE